MITRRSSARRWHGLLVAPAEPRTACRDLRRVGFLAFSSEATSAHLRAAFTQGMQDLGWLEGKNVEYRFVYANGDVDRLDALASELIGQRVDVILVGAGKAPTRRTGRRRRYPSSWRASATPWAPGLSPVWPSRGQHHRLHQPAGRGAGQADRDPARGRARRPAHRHPVERKQSVACRVLGRAQSACAALDLVALRVVASTPAQLGAAVEQIVRQRAQAIVVTSDSMYFTERAKLQELMQTTRLPVAYALRDNVVAGGLLSYGYDAAANYRNAAKYVDKILKGAKPADLPVEQATKFDLVINLKTAKALGITIPKAMLLRADEVIQ